MEFRNSVQKGALLISATFLILAFQNCSNGASFDGGAIIAKADDGSNLDDGSDENNDNDGDDGYNGGDGGGNTPGTPGRGGGGGGGCDSRDGSRDSKASSSSLKYLCAVRDENGSSARIALLDSAGASSREVCMTENACVKILNSKFDVRRAEKSGACPADGKKKVSLTDSDIETALAKADLLKALKEGK